jgi:hypothetical protein
MAGRVLTRSPAFIPRTTFQLPVQRMFQLQRLNEDERDLLESPPDSHHLTLDGHCALAASHGHVVVYDLEGAGLSHVDPAELQPAWWVS